MLRALGADRVIDNTREDATRGERRYDFVFDVPANRPFSAWRRALTAESRYVPIGHESYGSGGRAIFGLIPYFFSLMFRARFDEKLGSGNPSSPGKSDAIAILAGLLGDGKVTPIVDRVLPLSEVREAFRHLVEDELYGKVILTP